MRGFPSLNDCLYEGPSLLPEIAGIQLRARLHKHLLIADVEKAFHQVRLQISQRDVTRFLWLKDTNRPPDKNNLRYFLFTRIPFGVKSSPFVLAASIRIYLLHIDSRLCKEIERNTYVDNVILSASSHDEALEKYRTAKSIFDHMHVNLREFLCSSALVNQQIDPKDRAKEPEHTKLLGIMWSPDQDMLAIPIKTIEYPVVSKRTALRAYASTYDPLGLLTPFMVPFKIFIQDLWLKKLGWDDQLDKETLKEWQRICQDVQDPLPPFHRRVTTRNIQAFDLCIFGDASKRVFGTCAYLVSRAHNATDSHLIMARSHLNEPTPITIPRMELLAARNCVSLAEYLQKELDLKISSIHIFSDSQIVLHWIHSTRPLKQFVHNRVTFIRKTIKQLQNLGIDVKFHYVTSEDNPADHATRGLTTKEAVEHVWWTGPSFIRRLPKDWPKKDMDFTIPPVTTSEQDKEFAQVSLVRDDSHVSVIPFFVTNGYMKLLRITVYIVRFLRRRIVERLTFASKQLLNKAIPILSQIPLAGNITAQDIALVEILVIREHYRESSHLLERFRLDRFNAHRDEDGLIRCPARLEKAYRTVPILLVPSHRLTSLIVLHSHITSYHQGVYGTIAQLCRRFFIPSTRRTVDRILRTCVVCKKSNGPAYRYPDMPSLPEERVIRSRPFQNIGLDYLGPIEYRDHAGIRAKAWICLITCMATRAVHFEVVSSCSTQDFLLAFRRFIGRRGIPDVIYSDNATTFHAAEDAIKNLFFAPRSRNDVYDFVTSHRVTWKFITPVSPWEGGFYERLVALFKSAFKKTVGKSRLTWEQLRTIVVVIEAVINSRPITPYREKDASFRILRPVDFISPEVSLQLPPQEQEYDIAVDGHRLADWYREAQVILNSFWRIWYTDYLSALIQRHQCRLRQPRFTAKHPQVNDLVIVAEDNVPRGQWKMAIVVRLYGSDRDSARTAEIRTPNGHILRRPLSRLHPLEIRAQDDYTPIVEHKRTPYRRRVSTSPTRIQPPRKAKSLSPYAHRH